MLSLCVEALAHAALRAWQSRLVLLWAVSGAGGAALLFLIPIVAKLNMKANLQGKDLNKAKGEIMYEKKKYAEIDIRLSFWLRKLRFIAFSIHVSNCISLRLPCIAERRAWACLLALCTLCA